MYCACWFRTTRSAAMENPNGRFTRERFELRTRGNEGASGRGLMNNPINIMLLSGTGPKSFLIKSKLPRYNAYYSGFGGLLAAGNTIPVPNGVRDKNSLRRGWRSAKIAGGRILGGGLEICGILVDEIASRFRVPR